MVTDGAGNRAGTYTTLRARPPRIGLVLAIDASGVGECHPGPMHEHALTGIEGVRCVPERHHGVGALVLAGSSGRVDTERARMLAANDVLAESIRWFGGDGQNDGPWEIPIETFLDRVALLRRDCDRVIVVGTSFGAEAALLTGVLSDRVDAVVAFAPSDVVWAGITTDDRVTSHWTYQGEPLPYVPFADDWTPDDDPPAYVGLYRRSRQRFADDIEAATIAVADIPELILVAGGDDKVWPSVAHAARIRQQRSARGRLTTLVIDSEAGHRTVLPGEPVVNAGTRMQRGGNESADRRLGRAAWDHIKPLFS